MSLDKRWQDSTLVAFDLETTGKYPLESEICEIAAVKWQQGTLSEWSQLVKPRRPIPEEVIRIHGITNEMVESSPSIDDVLPSFLEFARDTVMLAHNAPFDMGFLTADIERLAREMPESPVLCTCLLARRLILDSPNHRLQTLVHHLGVTPGRAHRALDDAKACLEVAMATFKRAGDSVSIDRLIELQGERLDWPQFSLGSLRARPELQALMTALADNAKVQIEYEGGTHPGVPRVVTPQGVVRTPRGDFIVAICGRDQTLKRFFIDKIRTSRPEPMGHTPTG